MSDIVGTPKKAVIGGITFRVAADAAPKHGKPQYKNEAESTTGGNFRKMTLQDEAIESLTLIVNGDELAELQDMAESTDEITLAVKTAEGATYSSTGFIDFDSRDASTGKVDIKMIPTVSAGWTYFSAS
jgi:hypothetical protein